MPANPVAFAAPANALAISDREAAARMGVTQRTLYGWRRAGYGPPPRPGRRAGALRRGGTAPVARRRGGPGVRRMIRAAPPPALATPTRRREVGDDRIPRIPPGDASCAVRSGRARRLVPCLAPTGGLAVCNRVASDKPARGEGGGWVHRLAAGGDGVAGANAARPDRTDPHDKLAPADCDRLAGRCRAALSPRRLDALADRLTVSAASLRGDGRGMA